MLIPARVAQQPDGYLDKTPWFQFILLSSLFSMWGAAAGLNDILISQFKAVFELSDLASAFVQSAFYLGYFVIAIPSALLIRKASYKLAILIGLGIYIVGCTLFFPASHVGTYTVFLAAIFAIAIGLSFLETAANTYSSMLGPRGRSTWRINVSQTFTPIGNITGVLLGKFLIFDAGDGLAARLEKAQGQEKHDLAEIALQRTLTPYQVILAVLVVLLILFVVTKFPRGKAERRPEDAESATVSETFRYLSRNPLFLKGIAAQFVYVGLQVSLWSFVIRLALSMNPHLNERAASDYTLYALIAFFLGKFPANWLMVRFSPTNVVMAYCALGTLSLLYAALVPNQSAIWAVVLGSALMGPGWATIYGRTLDTIEDKRYQEIGGSIIVMAIIGGAVVPVIQGAFSDHFGSIQLSYVVLAACFALLCLYFWDQRRNEKKASADSYLRETEAEALKSF